MKQTISGKMRTPSNKVMVLALLLPLLLLAAQVHCCISLAPSAQDSHICPICCATGTAIVTSAIRVELAPVAKRLEVSWLVLAASFFIPRDIAPRGPPSLA